MPTALISLFRVACFASTVATFAMIRWFGGQGDMAEHLRLLLLLRRLGPLPAAPSIFLISSIPQIGQVPGLSLMMKGCMEQV